MGKIQVGSAEIENIYHGAGAPSIRRGYYGTVRVFARLIELEDESGAILLEEVANFGIQRES